MSSKHSERAPISPSAKTITHEVPDDVSPEHDAISYKSNIKNTNGNHSNPSCNNSNAPEHVTVGIGVSVEARFGGQEDWFIGKISNINNDGTFAIKYSDQDYESSVAADLIRVASDGGQVYKLSDITSRSTQIINNPSPPQNINNPSPPRSPSVLSQSSQHHQQQYQQEQQNIIHQPTPSLSTKQQLHSVPQMHQNNSFHKAQSAVDISPAFPVTPPPEMTSPNGEIANVLYWRISAHSITNDAGSSNGQVLNIRFTLKNSFTKTKQTAQFEFHLSNDIVQNVANELSEEMKLGKNQSDLIAARLEACRNEYYNYLDTKSANSPDFRIFYEYSDSPNIGQQQQEQQEKVDQEEAEYNRLIAEETKKYQMMQLKHQKKLDEIIKSKEAYLQKRKLNMAPQQLLPIQTNINSNLASSNGGNINRNLTGESLSRPVSPVPPSKQEEIDFDNSEEGKKRRRELAEKRIREEKEVKNAQKKKEAQEAEKKLFALDNLSNPDLKKEKKENKPTIEQQRQKKLGDIQQYGSAVSNSSSLHGVSMNSVSISQSISQTQGKLSGTVQEVNQVGNKQEPVSNKVQQKQKQQVNSLNHK